MTDAILIDGAKGEGGGQVLRTSLSLSMLTGRPVRLINIRSGRKKPGLMRQHLTCVKAAAEISSAKVQGYALNSQELIFEPGEVAAGEYSFRIGSAGSTSLVLQTVFPALAACKVPSTVHLEGGTHNPLAPSADFLIDVFAPSAARFGFPIDVVLHRHGFIPAGGGSISATIHPASARGVTLLQRDGTAQYSARVLVSQLDWSIAEREIKTLVRRLAIDEDLATIEMVESRGPGNVVLVGVRYDNCTELVCEAGRIGMKAERVARSATVALRKYIASIAPIGEHLGDQVMLLAAIAAGQGESSELLIQQWTSHCATHQMVLEAFLPVRFDHCEVGGATKLSVTAA